MSTASNATPAQGDSGAPVRLNPMVLLAIYVVVPALLWFALVDYLFTDLRLSHKMEVGPQSILLVGVLLQAPHNFASILTFLDREYIREYRGKLLICLGVTLASLSIPWFFGEGIFSFFILAYTFYHQSAQQAGIASMLARNKSAWHETWRWMSFVILMFGILYIVARTGQGTEVFFQPPLNRIIGTLALVYLVLFTAVSFIVYRQAKTKVGRYYVLANTAMFFAYSLFMYLDLPFFMLFIPVFVHDITAFAFYINHNQNRNRTELVNLVSKVRGVLPMPEYLLTPIAGMLLGMLFLFGMGSSLYVYAAAMLNVAHFYLEGVMWKNGTPHRRHIVL